MNNKIFLLPIITILIVLGASFAFAQNPPDSGVVTPNPPDSGVSTSKPDSVVKLESPLKAKNLKELLFSLVDLAISLGSIIAIFMFIWIGFKFVLARGNSSELSSAREWFLYAVIGTAILISSKVIVEVVKNTLIASGVANEEIWK